LVAEKDLGITEVRGAKANIPDIQVYGDGDTFALLCKASSQSQGWMKSTKVCNVEDGCIVQVTTQQRNSDSSYAVAEALTYVPNVHIDTESEPRKLVPVRRYFESSPGLRTGIDEEAEKRYRRQEYLHLLLEAQKAGVNVELIILDEIEAIKP
jgi:hypothetical protein